MAPKKRLTNRKREAGETALLRQFVAIIAHDMGHVVNRLSLATLILKKRQQASPAIKEHVKELTAIAMDLERTSRAMRHIAVEDQEIVCNFVDDIWKPVVAFLWDYSGLLAKVKTATTATALPNVRLRPGPIRLALISLLTRLHADVISCESEPCKEGIAVRVSCRSRSTQDNVGSFKSEERQFYDAGAVANINCRGNECVLILRLEVAPDDSVHR